MPIFEYQCQACGNRFEQILIGGSIAGCPACNVGMVQKQISAVAVGGPGGQWDGGASSGSCGSCGDPRSPGACPVN